MHSALPGVFFRSCAFQPTFQKHAGVTCGGVQIHVTDRDVFEPVFAGIAMVKVIHDMYKDEFRWKVPPYEYVFDKNPFDVIAGTNKIREAFEQGSELDAIAEDMETTTARVQAIARVVFDLRIAKVMIERSSCRRLKLMMSSAS